MIAFSIIPLAYLSAGVFSDKVFEPLMAEGGILASSVGQIIGVGSGRGIGLLFVIMGALWALSALGALFYPPVRRMEIELPDAVQSAGSY